MIPAEDITYVHPGKTFARTVGSNKLVKRHRRRSVTPPPSSRKVSLARSTPLTHKAATPLSHKAATPLPHKVTESVAYKATAPPIHKPTSPLIHKPTTPPPPVASCLFATRSKTAEYSQIGSLNRPSPIFKYVQRGAIPPAVLRKESEMNLISPSSERVLPAHSSKVPLGTKAGPSSKSVSALESTKLCSTSNQATLKCQGTKIDADPIVEKEHTVKPSLLSPTSVLSLSSSEVCPDTGPKPLSRLNLFDGKCKMATRQPETNISQAKSPLSTIQAPCPDQECVEMSNDFEAVPSTKRRTKNEGQTNQEASISCNMSSGAPAVLHTKMYKKPDQSKSTTQAPHVELSNDFEAVPSTKSHIRNEQQTNQEASTSCNMSSGAPAILDTEVCKKPYQPESTTRGPCVELSNDLDTVPSTKSHMKNERQTNQEASISSNMPSGSPLILHTEPRKTYRPDACWKGKFEVTGELTHTCDELEAHFPLEIFIKVYEASKQMPEVLKLEALPLSHLLPKKFKMEPPDAKDIGMCFISSHQRPNGNFDHLLENVSTHIGLRTDVGTTELLIFSSKLLTEDDQKKDGKLYFCGIFRKPLRKKQRLANNHYTDNVDINKSSQSKGDSHISEDIGMKLDASGVNNPMEIGKIFDTTTDGQTETVKCKKSGFKLRLTGEEETNKVIKCLPLPKTPGANAVINAAPAPEGSPCKSATRAPACGDPVLDSPSAFSVDVPPGFTRAHCRLRTGETAESHIDVPPGFTLAHRGLHTNDAITAPGSENGVSTLFSEKKSPIKFSLNITKPVQTDALPGFTKLLQVKKESGLPTFSKATEKITPIEKVEVDDGSEERQILKIRRLSDILGFSSSNNSSTSSRPRNRSEVCRSAAAVPLFQERGPAEREKLCRKRGQPEPSEPSAAEATKRPKVNGRMALNGSVDRRALNSNQAQR